MYIFTDHDNLRKKEKNSQNEVGLNFKTELNVISNIKI